MPSETVVLCASDAKPEHAYGFLCCGHCGPWHRRTVTLRLITAAATACSVAPLLAARFSEARSASRSLGAQTNTKHCSMHAPRTRRSGPFVALEWTRVDTCGFVDDRHAKLTTSGGKRTLGADVSQSAALDEGQQGTDCAQTCGMHGNSSAASRTACICTLEAGWPPASDGPRGEQW
jgi:hypothetical protein